MPSYPPPPFQNNDWRTQRQILREQARLQRMQLRGMRRSSIVGPLLAVAIGVLFLLVQVGRLPSLRVWDFIGHWWPLLLILIGLIRLGEWFLDHRARTDLPPGAPVPYRSLGGGVITLILLLMLAGIGFSLATHHSNRFLGNRFELNQDNLDEFLGDKHESTQTPITEALTSGTVLNIDNPRGDVTISGMSDDGQVHITAQNQVFSRSDSEAAQKAQQLAPRIDRGSNELSIRVPTVESARVDLTVTMPGGHGLTVHANRGEIRVHSVRGPVDVTANHGDVDLSTLTGTVSAHVNNGDSSFAAHSLSGPLSIEGRSLDLTLSDTTGPVTMNGEFFGTVHLERASGAVKFHTSRIDLQLARIDGELEISPNADLTADQIMGPTTLNTRNRNINLERVAGDLSIINRNGSITVTAAPPLGAITIENRNSPVDLTLPEGESFSVQAETSNADLENDFGLTAADDDSHPRLSGNVGKGGPAVHVTTTQADISIHKGNIAPLAPQAPAPPPFTPRPSGSTDVEKQIDSARKQAAAAQKQAAAAVRQARQQAEAARRSAEQAAPSGNDSK